MSWTFNLTIPLLARRRNNQKSPLRFATFHEANEFGKRMFEPPKSVEDWEVVESKLPANFPLR